MVPVGLFVYLGLAHLSGRTEEISSLALVIGAVWILTRLALYPLTRLQQGLGEVSRFNSLRSISEIGPPLGFVALAAGCGLNLSESRSVS